MQESVADVAREAKAQFVRAFCTPKFAAELAHTAGAPRSTALIRGERGAEALRRYQPASAGQEAHRPPLALTGGG